MAFEKVTEKLPICWPHPGLIDTSCCKNNCIELSLFSAVTYWATEGVLWKQVLGELPQAIPSLQFISHFSVPSVSIGHHLGKSLTIFPLSEAIFVLLVPVIPSLSVPSFEAWCIFLSKYGELAAVPDRWGAVTEHYQLVHSMWKWEIKLLVFSPPHTLVTRKCSLCAILFGRILEYGGVSVL